MKTLNKESDKYDMLEDLGDECTLSVERIKIVSSGNNKQQQQQQKQHDDTWREELMRDLVLHAM